MADSERILNDWIDSFMEYTNDIESPISFRLWTAIAVIASAMMRKCYLIWGPSLVFYPNLYIVLVGPSGSRKGTAMNPGLDMIRDANIRVAANATTWQALVRKLKDNNLNDIDADTGAMYFHSSLSIYSKEFTVFLGYQNRELMSALCDWYDCDRDWTYETISRKEEKIIGVWVNLVGATTPDLISASLPIDAIGGGLTSRIIFIYEEDKGKIVARQIVNDKLKRLYGDLVHDLEHIKTSMSGQFLVTPEYADLWEDWYVATETGNPIFTDGRLQGYLERRATHIMKLSMVMSASRSTGPRMTLTADDFNRAKGILTGIEGRMPLVFGGVGRADHTHLINRMMIFFSSNQTREVKMSEIISRYYYEGDLQHIQTCIETLEKMGYLDIPAHRAGADYCVKFKGKVLSECFVKNLNEVEVKKDE